MEWTIVHFLEDNVVETVPSSWVCDDICYWPPYNMSKITQAISSCMSPTIGEWNVCKIRQLANGRKYNNLVKAKLMCAKAEYTSDLNSDMEIKRQIKKKRFFDEENSEENISEIDCKSDLVQRTSSSQETSESQHANIECIKPARNNEKKMNSHVKPKQKLTLKKPTFTGYKVDDISDSSSDSERDILSNAILPSSPVAVKCTEPVMQTNNVQKYTEIKNSGSSMISTSLESSSQPLKARDNLYDENFQKQVLRQLQIINLRQQQMSEDLGVLLLKANSERNEENVLDKDSIFKKFNFPLTSQQDLIELEDFLMEDNSFKQFVNEITQIGGASYKHMVKRVMPKIMSNNLSKSYSWLGFKRKNKFCNLRICSAILISVQKTYGSSEAMVETIIKYWLVKSNEREKASLKDKL